MTLFFLLIPISLILLGTTLPYRNALPRAARLLGAVQSGRAGCFSGTKDGVQFRLEQVHGREGKKTMRVVCSGLDHALDPVTFSPAGRRGTGEAIDGLPQFSRYVRVEGSMSTATSYLDWTTRKRLLVVARRWMTVRLGPDGCVVEARGALFYTEELQELVRLAVGIAAAVDEQNPDERQRLLAIALSDSNSSLRRYALHLAQAQNPTNPLLRKVAGELASSPDPTIALKAAELLGDEGVEVIAHLFATDPPVYLQLEALEAVDHLNNDASVVRLLSGALRSQRAAVRIAALEIGTNRKTTDLTAQVIDRIGTSGVKERDSIARFLAATATPGTEDAMLFLLSWPSRRLLKILIPAFKKTGTGRALNRLVELQSRVGRTWDVEDILADGIATLRGRCSATEGGELSLADDGAAAGALTMTSQAGALTLSGTVGASTDESSVNESAVIVEATPVSIVSPRPLNPVRFPEFLLRFSSRVIAAAGRILTYGMLVVAAIIVVCVVLVFFTAVF